MNKPLVSIIIPTYNRSQYLKKAINSVLKQTYENIEVLIIDDNSYDDTISIIKNFNDKRICYYKNVKNNGPAYCRNKGIAFSKGKYLNFLDDDDILLPKKIELQIRKFEESKYKRLGVITCDVEYKRKSIKEVKRNRKNGNIYRDLLKSYCIYGTETMLINRNYISDFDLNLVSNQEYDLALRLARVCEFDYVPKRLSIKFDSKKQITYNFKKKIRGTLYLYRKYKNEFKKHGFKFYLYNYLRFKYLLLKYTIGLIIGKNTYKLLKIN